MKKYNMNKVEHWQQYWLTHPTLNSFDFDYHDANGPYLFVKEHWQRVWQDIISSDVVVDLAAGKGALAKLAYDDNVQCHAFISIDSAHSQTANINNENAFRFDKGNIERLSLDDSSINLAVSMFGIEYANLTKVFVELERCVSRQFHFLCHHPDSIITQKSRITHAIVDELFATESIKNVLEHRTRTIPDTLLLSELKTILNAQTCPHFREEVMYIGRQAAQIVMSNMTDSQKFTQFVTWIEAMQHNQVRLNEQIVAADNITQWLNERPELETFNISTKTMLYKDTPFAWNIIGNKKY